MHRGSHPSSKGDSKHLVQVLPNFEHAKPRCTTACPAEFCCFLYAGGCGRWAAPTKERTAVCLTACLTVCQHVQPGGRVPVQRLRSSAASWSPRRRSGPPGRMPWRACPMSSRPSSHPPLCRCATAPFQPRRPPEARCALSVPNRERDSRERRGFARWPLRRSMAVGVDG